MERLHKSKYRNLFYVFLYLLFVILIWYLVSSFLVDKEAVRKIVSGYGVFGPLVFILIQILQNVVAPISHYPILLAGGFIFGPFLGFLYNWIGTVLGTYLIILLTKKWGRPLVVKMVKRETINKYDNFIKKLSPFGLFLLYFLPVFPDDEITYLIGLSSMPQKSIVLAIILGKMGGATLSFIGSDAIKGVVPAILLNIFIFIPCVLIYFHKEIFNFFRVKVFRGSH